MALHRGFGVNLAIFFFYEPSVFFEIFQWTFPIINLICIFFYKVHIYIIYCSIGYRFVFKVTFSLVIIKLKAFFKCLQFRFITNS